MKKNNEVLRKEIIEALNWEPQLQSNEIEVSVQDGAVTLGGNVENYAQKKEAEEVVKGISGVKTVLNEVSVELYSSSIKDDKEVANAVIKALSENWNVPDHKIKVTVEAGWVTLEGILHWNFQRKAAENAIGHLKGVRGVIDKIKIEAEMKNEVEKELVEKALKRSWILDINNIKVRVDGKTVSLSGFVDSLFQKEEAERIAWNTPGVCQVDNELLVELD